MPQLETGFLVCEDFGTRGLGGNPLLNRDPKIGSTDRQDFFWFWRNIGRSGKTGEDLGRWGLGKTVYRAASDVGCMLGLTVRDEDERQLLMGQAVLDIHDFDGREYVPEGYWCAGQNGDGVPLPVEDAENLNLFRKEWKLTRQDDEPGLSVVVPYVSEHLKGEKLLQAVCVHFFVPILRGELIVDLRYPDGRREREIRLDSESIEKNTRKIEWKGHKRTKRHAAPPIAFVSRCLGSTDKIQATEILSKKKIPTGIDEDAFAPEVLEQLRTDFSKEKLVAVNVRLHLPKKVGKAVTGELLVFVQRGGGEDVADTYFVREGMTITKPTSRASSKGIHAFVNVEKHLVGTTASNPLASLLGDSEGPAHEDWDKSQTRPDQFWKGWKGRVTFCREMPRAA